MGRTRTTEYAPARSPAPVSPRQIIGHPAGHLKDASGAAPAATLRPVLTHPAGRYGHGSYQGNSRRQSRMPESSQHRSQTPFDRPPLQG